MAQASKQILKHADEPGYTRDIECSLRHGGSNDLKKALAIQPKDLADIGGTTLHTASRILTAWEKAGFLATHNQRLTIRQPSEILRVAEDAPD